MSKKNNDLRLTIAEMVSAAGEGHIPSAYSIVEILTTLYGNFLRFDAKNPEWEGRDYFVLSKGHGCAALYVLLERYGFITRADLEKKSKHDGILGGHPDCTKVPGVEVSSGSLGHGIVTAMGIALGLKIQKKRNRVIALVGDGECNEGTVWETALVAANLRLGNFCIVIDENGSADQVLPVPHLKKKWSAFGWNAYEVDGHSEKKILTTFQKIKFSRNGKPTAIIAHTTKGKGVNFMEGHGKWHHKIPSSEELELIRKELV